MAISVIGETERLQALYLPGDGDVLLITFNGMGMRPNGRTFSAATVAQKLGMPALGIMSREPNWFPEDDMRALMPALAPYLARHSRRLSYGFSMGGYGALKYSRALGTEAVLSLSPQSSVDPDFVPWERRYRRYVRDFHRGERLRAGDIGGHACVIVDLAHAEDRRHIGIINQLCDARIINATGVGHATFELFLGSGIVRELFSAVMGRDAARIRSLVRERKRHLPDFPMRLWLSRARGLLDQGRHGQAARAAERALRHEPDSVAALVLLAKCHVASRHHAAAEEAIGRAEALDSPEAWLRLELAQLRKSLRTLPDRAREPAWPGRRLSPFG